MRVPNPASAPPVPATALRAPMPHGANVRKPLATVDNPRAAA